MNFCAVSCSPCVTRGADRLTVTILLLAALIVFAPAPAAAVKPVGYSSSFQSLLNEVQKTYIAPRGGTLNQWERQRSRDLATVVGHALRQQQGYVKANPSLQGAYDNLVREAGDYIGRIASMTGQNPQSLIYAMNRAMQGADDQMVYSRYRVRVGSMPCVIVAAKPPGGPLADLPLREEKPGEQIDLLNTRPSKTPDEAKATYNRGVDYWNAGSKAWNAGDQDTARSHYGTAANYWAKACQMGWVDGCRGTQGLNYGQYLRYWGQ